jgi:hypothetical protein
MKKIIINGVIIFAIGLLTPQFVGAQGVVYLSNLGNGIADSRYVGSNSWMAASFQTGTNAGGYVLNSIQLEMGNAYGNPSGFAVLFYSASSSLNPGSKLGTLSGSSNPATSGIYTYTDDSNIMLLPQRVYYMVLTADTPFVGAGAGVPFGYVWDRANNTSSHYNPSDGWFGADGYGYSSNYGSSWDYNTLGIDFQYAINATAVPEPGVLSLIGLGGLGFLWHRRKAKVL